MSTEKRKSIVTIAAGLTASLIIVSCAAAQTQVFVDNFKNGSVANSDTQTGFWQTILDGNSSATEPVGGPLNLRVQSGGAGDAYPLSEIGTTSTQSSFNFFQQPIVLSVSGLGFSADSTSNALTEFNFASEPLNYANGIVTEYNEPSAFSIQIEPLNGPDGQILMGEKANYPTAATIWNAYQLIGPIGPGTYGTKYGTQTLSGQVRGFTLVLSSQFYVLQVTSDTSPTDSTPVTTTYFSNINLMNTGQYPWTTGAYAPGDPSLNVEAELNNTSKTTDLASMNVGQIAVSQMPSTWTNASGDNNWLNAANWSGLSSVIDSATAASLGINVPNYASASAIFPQASGPTTINIDSGDGGNTSTVGTMTFNSTQPYTITGSYIGLATSGSTGQINVTAGNHTINAIINLYGNTVINTAAGSSLTVTGYLFTEAPGYSLTKNGGGTANITGGFQNFAGLTINQGTAKDMPGATPNDIGSANLVQTLTIASGAHLDLTNNDMVIDYTGSSPLQTVRQYLHDGSLMSSSAPAGSGMALGYAEASDIGQTTTFNQIPTDSTSIAIMYTYDGDTNLDGVVDPSDYQRMLNGNGSDWYEGDLNYDGVKNGDDWALFMLGDALSQAHGNINAVPEPASLAIFGVAGLLFIQRRRRS